MAEDYFGIVGTVQGPFHIKAVVAEGGFGVVYRAYHEAFQSDVALKCLKIPIQMDDENQREFLSKFKEEGALLFKLSASIPAVVRPLHIDKIDMPDGRFVPYMALEWLEGEGLDALIQRRADQGQPPLGLKKAVRLLTPVARALARAHHFRTPEGPISIVHRDIKPDNIFIAKVNGEEVVKIFDFGIAKARSVASQVAGRLSQSPNQVTAFTPGYGAPEQWLPKRFGQTGPWTDVFGLALTVLETAIGRPIIDGDTTAMMGTACDERRRPTPRNEGLEVSDQVEAVFLAALAVDPRNRYPEAGQFWDALETALGLELSSTPTQTSARSATEDSVVAPLPAPFDLRGQVPNTLPQIELDLPASRPASSSRSGMSPMARPAPVDTSDPPASNKPGRSSVGEGPFDHATAPKIDLDLDLDANRRSAGTSSGNRPAPVPMSLRSGAGASGAYPRVSGESGPSSRIAPTVPVREEPVVASTLARIRTPVFLTAAGIAVAILDRIIVATLDNEFHLGPVRLSWVAALIIVAGVLVIMKRLIFSEEER
ncbi:MAG: serine/threonine-protein kinase [Myxococcales bacterium]|nr:serine/threonine protein kinase [Polyangiaceae bacterium]MDW8249716.1 serine/threonine-protein kinase [Myxococcales bacterium]